MKHTQAVTLRRLWHSIYAAETSCLLLEQSGIWLTSNSMPAYALLALIALITGPNSTRLCLMQFMSVTRAIPFALTVMLLILHRIFLHFSIRGRGVNELSNKDTQSKKGRSYSAPNKERSAPDSNSSRRTVGWLRSDSGLKKQVAIIEKHRNFQ